MGWGVFCALCGGPFEGDILPYDGYLYPEDRGLSDEQLREFTAETYCMEYDDCCDSSVLKRQSIAWLKDLRVIGKGNHKAFITGIGQEFESGSVSVDPGDDPNVPTPDQLNAPLQPGRLRHEVYFTSLNTLDHPSFPMHAKCFDVLTEAHKHRSITKDGRQIPLDLEKLHRGMSKRYPAHYTHLGLRKYAEFAEGIGQWWTGPFASLEVCHFNHFESSHADLSQPWYHDPLDIPVLTALNKTEQPRRVRVWARGTESAANCLSDLPVELLVLIANHLDTKSVIKLTRTCREVNAILSKNFWRNRLFLDMPYLFEIRDKVNQDAAASSSIDWQDLYGRMMLQSYPGKWDRVWWKFTDSSRKCVNIILVACFPY